MASETQRITQLERRVNAMAWEAFQAQSAPFIMHTSEILTAAVNAHVPDQATRNAIWRDVRAGLSDLREGLKRESEARHARP